MVGWICKSLCGILRKPQAFGYCFLRVPPPRWEYIIKDAFVWYCVVLYNVYVGVLICWYMRYYVYSVFHIVCFIWLGVYKKVIRGCAGLWKGFAPTDLIGYEDKVCLVLYGISYISCIMYCVFLDGYV